jgi:hypothetical protein
MAFDFTVSDIIPARPPQIYQAWLSSDGHRDITGGADAEISPQEGADFTAWDGYISGKNLKLEPDAASSNPGARPSSPTTIPTRR